VLSRQEVKWNQQMTIARPVGYAGWVNPDWKESGAKVILLRIGYESPEGCDLPDEWFTQVVEP